MKALLLVFLISLILSQTLLAQEEDDPVGPEFNVSGVTSNTLAQAGTQHRQTDSEFLAERARNRASANVSAADLEAILVRTRALQDRLAAYENIPPQPATQEHILLGRQVGTPSEPKAEKRIPQTLKHRDRAVNDPDDYGRIKVKLSAVEEETQFKLRNVKKGSGYPGGNSNPGGGGSNDSQTGPIRFGDGVYGRHLPKSEGTQPEFRYGNFSQLQQDLDAVEEEIEQLERRDKALNRKKPGRLK